MLSIIARAFDKNKAQGQFKVVNTTLHIYGDFLLITKDQHFSSNNARLNTRTTYQQEIFLFAINYELIEFTLSPLHVLPIFQHLRLPFSITILAISPALISLLPPPTIQLSFIRCLSYNPRDYSCMQMRVYWF